VDPYTGALTAIEGSPFDPGAPAYTLTVHPSGRFLYLKSSSIMGIAIDPSTGRLLGAVPGSPPSAEGYRLTVSPDGQSLYIGDGNYGGPVGFHVDAGTGALTPLPRTFADVSFDVMAFAPSGRALYGVGYLYTGRPLSLGLWVYEVDPSTSILGNLRRVAEADLTPGEAKSLAIDPFGRFLYLASSSLDGMAPSAQIDAVAIDPSTGNLSTVPGSPFSQEPVERGGTLGQLVVDPTGRFLYASRGASVSVASDIWAYAIDQGNGVLSPVAGSPFLKGRGVGSAGPADLAFDPGGKRLYVAACDQVHIFDVDDRGRLTPLASDPWLVLRLCSYELGIAP
jgi:6-phosphogluconolactonase